MEEKATEFKDDISLNTDLKKAQTKNQKMDDAVAQSVNSYLKLKTELGVSVRQAQAEMDALSDQLGRVFPAENAGWRAEVMPFQQALVTEVRPTLLVLDSSVSLLLLIATVNVGVLFLARRIQRQKDVSISVALGATHWRIVRQAIVVPRHYQPSARLSGSRSQRSPHARSSASYPCRYRG